MDAVFVFNQQMTRCQHYAAELEAKYQNIHCVCLAVLQL